MIFRCLFVCSYILFSSIYCFSQANSYQSFPYNSFTQNSISDSLNSGSAHSRRPLYDLGNAIKTIGTDAWYLTTSPLRIRKHQIYWLGGLTAATAILYQYDDRLVTRIREVRHDPVWEQVLDIGDQFEPIGYMGFTNKFYVAGIGIGYITRWDWLTRVSAEIFEANMLAGLFKNVANLAGRARPHEGLGPYHFDFRNGTSFPSGHAVVIFNLATILSHHVGHRSFSIAAYGIAATVGLQRFASRGHWPSDVLVGAALGTAVSRTLIKLHEKNNLAVLPYFTPEDNLIGLKWQVCF
ncbi:phosphatase PAP2 family protein [candidate division KSB1 bacterium]|nr:phosphatase PAP2 family protein [candidate division KSB1 bacterium]